MQLKHIQSKYIIFEIMIEQVHYLFNKFVEP